MTRIGIRLGIVVLILLGLLFTRLILNRAFFTENSHYTLQKFHWKDAENIDIDALERKLELVPGEDNIYEIDIKKVRRTLESDSQIVKADVKRVLPGTLEIKVYIRSARAQLKRAGGYLLDDQGIILPANKDPNNRKLPIITGFRSTELNEGDICDDKIVVQALNYLRYLTVIENGNWLQVERIVCVPKYDYFSVYLKENGERGIMPNTEIRMPINDLPKAMAKVRDILTIRHAGNLTTSFVDATLKKVPVRK